jgi:transcription elongation GreA/GreB family factor
MPELRKFKHTDARKLFLEHHPPKFKVDSKFAGDHQLESTNLSKKQSISAAIERYKKNQRITTSSWMVITPADVIGKAKNSDKIALIYSGKQQIAVTISVLQRTVEISRLTSKEAQTYKCEQVKIGKDVHYLNCTSEEKNVKISVVGPWNPLTGEISLYHYDAGRSTQADTMLDKYLEWHCDDKGKPIRPAAKR